MDFKSSSRIIGFLVLVGILMNFGMVAYADEEWLHINLETNHEDGIEPIMIKKGTELKTEILPELEDRDKEFAGWFFDAEFNEKFKDMKAMEDITLYAKWENKSEEKDEIDIDDEKKEQNKVKEPKKKKVIVKQNQKPSNVPNVTIFGDGPIPMEKLFDEPVLDKKDKSPYITGYRDGTFRPDDSVTREEFAMIIFRTLKDEILDESKTTEHDYKDITNLDYEEAIATLSKLNILNGYKDNTFKPIKYITRGEVAVVLARVNAIDEATNVQFSDVDNFWGKGHISAIADKNWITGYSDGTFRPNRNIKRSELVRMVNNALGRSETKEELGEIENKFTDIESFRWYYTDVLKAANK